MTASELPTNFKSLESEARFIAAYENTLSLWPIPYEKINISTIWGRTFIIACGPKNAPPLILLHGMHLSSSIWFANISALSKRYRVYAMDTIGGAGRSVAKHPPKNKSDLAGWLDCVFDSLGVTKLSILGHSYGGWLAINYVLLSQRRIDRLILLAPVGLRPFRIQFWLRGVPAAIFPHRFLVSSYMKWMTVQGFTVNKLFIDQFILGMQAFNPRFQIRVLPTVFTSNELQQINSPVLLLIGEKEVIYNPTSAIKWANQEIQNIRSEIVPNSSHGLLMEQAEVVNELVINY